MKPKQGILTLYKNRGETPLECLERFKKENPEYKADKMTYAGRLDPLAEGLLLVLVGEECKNKEKYLGMDKEYEVDVLFGFATDTYDILGILQTNAEKFSEVGPPRAFEVVPQKISSINLDSCLCGNDTVKEMLSSFVGKFSQKYPAYSSRNIKEILKVRKRKNGGLSLQEQYTFHILNTKRSRSCALGPNPKLTSQSEAGKGESSVFSEALEDVSEKEVEIKSIEFLEERTMSKKDLEKYIIDSIALVKGDFRQTEILKIWDSVLNGLIRENGRMIDNQEFKIISIRVNCTSGTYMRSLANSIGNKIGIPALALNIKRIKVGEFEI